MLIPATVALIRNDLLIWKSGGFKGFPQFSLATIAAVDLDTNGKGTVIEQAATATPIDWQALLTALLPLLVQLIPLLIEIFGGG